MKTEMGKLTAFLKTRRLRKTPERFEILQCVLDCHGHFDVDILYKALDKKGYHVSRATIYSTLELLTEAGIVRKLLFDTHQARYEIAGETHSHLVCVLCGEISEIDIEDLDSRLASMNLQGFKPAYVSTCIYGTCSKCESRINDREPDPYDNKS